MPDSTRYFALVSRQENRRPLASMQAIARDGAACSAEYRIEFTDGNRLAGRECQGFSDNPSRPATYQ